MRPFIASKEFWLGVATVLIIAALFVGWGSYLFAQAPTFRCTVAWITDGDTLRCRETDQTGRQLRIRISGINARETDGTCSPGHPCPNAAAAAGTAELRRLASGQVLSCRAVGTTYRRIAAFCTNEAGVDLSCAMVASGTAARWVRHWRGHRCR